MFQDIVGNGTSRLSKDITENVIKFQVGNSQAVLGPVLFAGEHIGKFDAIADQIPELPDFRRRDKTGFDHIAHE